MVKLMSKNEVCYVYGGKNEGQETKPQQSEQSQPDPFVSLFQCYSYMLGSIAVSVALCRNIYELANREAIIANPDWPVHCLIAGGANGFVMGIALCIGIKIK